MDRVEHYDKESHGSVIEIRRVVSKAYWLIALIFATLGVAGVTVSIVVGVMFGILSALGAITASVVFLAISVQLGIKFLDSIISKKRLEKLTEVLNSIDERDGMEAIRSKIYVTTVPVTQLYCLLMREKIYLGFYEKQTFGSGIRSFDVLRVRYKFMDENKKLRKGVAYIENKHLFKHYNLERKEYNRFYLKVVFGGKSSALGCKFSAVIGTANVESN